jgi:hypothetical protein
MQVHRLERAQFFYTCFRTDVEVVRLYFIYISKPGSEALEAYFPAIVSLNLKVGFIFAYIACQSCDITDMWTDKETISMKITGIVEI